MLKSLGPLLRFVLGMAVLLALLAVTAGLWWWLPVRPAYSWDTPSSLFSVWLSPSGRTLIAVHDENAMTAWDVPSAKLRACPPFVHTRQTFPYLWTSPDDRVLVYKGLVNEEEALVGWDLDANRERFAIGRDELILELLPDGDTLLTQNGSFISLVTGKPKPVPTDLSNLLKDEWMILRTTPHRILLLQERETNHYSLVVWDHSAAAFVLPPLRYAKSNDDYAFFIALSPAGNLLAMVDGPGAVLWDLDAREKIASFRQEGKWLTPWRFTPDGTRLQVITNDRPWKLETEGGTMQVWDVSARPPCPLGISPAHYSYFSPDGRWLLTPHRRVVRDGWTLAEHGTLVPFEVDAVPLFSADSQFLIGPGSVKAARPGWLPAWVPWKSTATPTLDIVAVGTNQWVASLPLPKGLGGKKVMPDWLVGSLAAGNKVLTFECSGRVNVWDVAPHRPWWIEYGLPVVFALLVLLGVRLVWPGFRKPAPLEPAPQAVSRLT